MPGFGRRRRRRIFALAGASVVLLGAAAPAACGQTSASKGATEGGEQDAVTGAGGSGTQDVSTATTAAGQGGSPDATSTGSTTGSDPACDEASPFLPKRLTRLSLPQLANSIEQLFGGEVAADVRSEFELASRTDRGFPALAHPSEGAAFVEQSWSKADGMAQRAGEYVGNDFTNLSGCDTNDVACSEVFLFELATEAYRRPLTSDEEDSLAQLIDDLLATEASAAELAQYGVHGILSSPAFLYRSEFGADPEQAGPLTASELASQIAYFLTDAPPDAELRQLAEAGGLDDEVTLEQQVVRCASSDHAGFVERRWGCSAQFPGEPANSLAVRGVRRPVEVVPISWSPDDAEYPDPRRTGARRHRVDGAQSLRP